VQFEILVRKVGFGLAVVLKSHELPEDFWASLTFGQWFDIYNVSFGDLKARALRTMKKLGTFDEWYRIYMGTFESWLQNYHPSSVGELRLDAVQAMTELSKRNVP